MDTFHLAGIPLAPDFSDFTQYYGSTLDAKKMSELLYHIGQGMRKPASFLPQKRNKSLPPHQPKTLRIPEKITV